jgi:hypothetical protein
MFSNFLAWLSRILLPNGRAFFMPWGGDLQKLFAALDLSETREINDARSIIDSRIPDNNNFTIEDARIWYKEFGIYDSGSVPLADMKARIRQQRRHPGETPAHLSKGYIEDQLRLANFDVHIYENRFSDGMGGWVTKTPAQILGIPAGRAVFGDFRFGQVKYGSVYSDAGITIVANSLEAATDENFGIGIEYKYTCYIAGATVSTFADIDAAREIEFRQLVHQLKGANIVAILFVNYI